MWGAWLFVQSLGPDQGPGWLNLLLGSGGLLAGLVVAVRAYDSGRVVTRAQHEAALRDLKAAHAAHVASLEARAAEDREQRARWESLAFEAWRVRRGLGEHGPHALDAERDAG